MLLYSKEKRKMKEKILTGVAIVLSLLVIYLLFRVSALERKLELEDLDIPLYQKISARLDNLERSVARAKEILPVIGKKIGIELDRDLNQLH